MKFLRLINKTCWWLLVSYLLTTTSKEGCVEAANPSYLMTTLARRSSSLVGSGGSRHLLQRRALVSSLRNSNSLLLRSTKGVASLRSNSYLLSPSRSLSTIITARHMVLDFFDPLEPFELLWELYCNRYEIMEELLAKIAIASKNNLIRAAVIIVPAYIVGDILARCGVIGTKGQGLLGYVAKKTRSSKRLTEGTKERAYQKTGAFLVDKSIDTFSHAFHMVGRRGKFAISVSAGVLFGQTIIRATAMMVRVTLISFFVIETMSFLGIIGECGESILQWVEDECNRHAKWTETLAKRHKELRKRMSLEWLLDLYENIVDEEKIASFGFSVGTVVALVT